MVSMVSNLFAVCRRFLYFLLLSIFFVQSLIHMRLSSRRCLHTLLRYLNMFHMLSLLLSCLDLCNPYHTSTLHPVDIRSLVVTCLLLVLYTMSHCNCHLNFRTCHPCRHHPILVTILLLNRILRSLLDRFLLNLHNRILHTRHCLDRSSHSSDLNFRLVGDHLHCTSHFL